MFPTRRFRQDTRTLILKSFVIDLFYSLEHYTEYNSSSPVYSPFSDRVGLPLHNIPFPGVLMLLFAMIRSVVKSFKVPDVEVVAVRMCNEAALTHMTDSTQKKLGHT